MLETLGAVTESVLNDIAEEKRLRRTNDVFLLFTLGSQFDHLIRQSLERLGLFCIVADPSKVTADDIRNVKPLGIILSGGPASVHHDLPIFDREILDLGVPVLGICLGFQLWAHHVGATVRPASKREFGVHTLAVKDASSLFRGFPQTTDVLESHADIVVDETTCLNVLASTENAAVAAAQFGHLWGVQFHPEVAETILGGRIFENFCVQVCGATERYPAASVAARKSDTLRDTIGSQRVVLALSGGSDSSVTAYLLRSAMTGHEGHLRAIYIKGVDRPDDEAHVDRFFGNQPWLELRKVDATLAFLASLKGQVTMRDKRIAIRKVYKELLEEEVRDFGASFVAQGTLYTDVSESGGGYHSGARKAQIKLHHNVGLDFSVTELTPLVDCVKDNARNIGETIGVPSDLLRRQPFPGPGLVVRIEGEVDADKLETARAVDQIYIEELRRSGLYHSVWQAGGVVTQSLTTCTKGDEAMTGLVVALWAVWSVNGFTAEAAELPHEFLKLVSRRITNEISSVGAVVYRVSGKPPSTIEWG